MNLNFKYLDENGNYVDGEILYETKIEGKVYVLGNLHYGPDNNAICAFKVIENGENQTFTKLDESDNIEAIMAQLNKIMREED